MKLTDVEKSWRDLVLATDARLLPNAPEAPDAPPVARQRLYRRLVRNNLFGIIRRAIPITRKLLGDEGTDALIALFLDEVGPKTRFVRHIALEWAEWLMARPELPHPAAGELAHWEVLEVDVALAPDWEGPAHPRTPDDSARIESHPSARLVAYRHPVHGLTKTSEAYPPPAGPDDAPFILLAWRAQERFVWQRLEGGTAKVLVETAQGKRIAEALFSIEASLVPGDSLDRGRVKADLVDLVRRGALVGFPRPTT